MPRKYWLYKSEPKTYSIDDLEHDGATSWEGVRNYQARNFMRDEIKAGDLVLFYHSNADPPGVAGIARVCREAYPDHYARRKKSKYYDPRSTKDNPIWLMVDVEFVEKFQTFVPLDTLRSTKELKDMLVIRRGQRLSIQPVESEHFKIVRKLGRKTGCQ